MSSPAPIAMSPIGDPSSDPTSLRNPPAQAIVTGLEEALLRIAPRGRRHLFLIPTGLLFHVVFAVYSFYFLRVQILFNTRIAVHVTRNIHTRRAFLFCYSIPAVPLVPFDAGIGVVVVLGLYRSMMVVERSLLIHKLHWLVYRLWCALVVFLCLSALIVVSFMYVWIPATASLVYSGRVFDHGCTATGWDLDIALAAVNITEMPFVVGNAHISWTRHRNDPFTAQLVRHANNIFHFDFAASGNTRPHIVNVTYDWENGTYVAFRPDSTSIGGTFTRTPSLTLPSLNVSVLDPFIPFERPGYPGCWPAAATLIVQGSPHKSLETLVIRKNQMKVCGRGAESDMSLDPELQISLGVVFIRHYLFSLCVKLL